MEESRTSQRNVSLALLCLIAFSGFTKAQTTTTPGDEAFKARVNHLMDTHILGVEQLRPPGWTIQAKPLDAERGADDTLIAQVHIYITGAPVGTIFELQTMPVGDDKATSTMQGISVGKDGILVCAGRLPTQCGDPQKPDDPIEFTSQTLKGEPTRYLFVSDAGTIGIVVVPYPVAYRDKGCTLSAVRLTPGFDLALITGTGLPPNTDIHYSAKSDRGNTHTIRSNELGVVRFSLIPVMKPGQRSGGETIKIIENQCSPEVSYEWKN